MEPFAPLPAEPLTRSTRDQILNAALATATTHGISRLSVGDVAKAAGLSRQTLYRHFTSKDDLIAAVVVQDRQGLPVAEGSRISIAATETIEQLALVVIE